MEPLWSMNTCRLVHRHNNEDGNTLYPYHSWKDFRDCRPYKLWKPYYMTSWAWKDNTFQIVFTTTYKNSHIVRFVEFPVKQEEEPAIRAWIKSHMPVYWNI